MLNGIKNIIISLHKGLLYWFFWASFVTLHDEKLCSVSALYLDGRRSMYIAGDSMPPAPRHKSEASNIFIRLCCDLRRTATQARHAFETFVADNLAKLRALADCTKELPQRHRLRIALYSG